MEVFIFPTITTLAKYDNSARRVNSSSVLEIRSQSTGRAQAS